MCIRDSYEFVVFYVWTAGFELLLHITSSKMLFAHSHTLLWAAQNRSQISKWRIQLADPVAFAIHLFFFLEALAIMESPPRQRCTSIRYAFYSFSFDMVRSTLLLFPHDWWPFGLESRILRVRGVPCVNCRFRLTPSHHFLQDVICSFSSALWAAQNRSQISKWRVQLAEPIEATKQKIA